MPEVGYIDLQGATRKVVIEGELTDGRLVISWNHRLLIVSKDRVIIPKE